MKLVGGSEVEHLTARVTLRYQKEHKNEANTNHIVVLGGYREPQNFVCDSIKLLMAHALRHGLIARAVTVRQALDDAQRHQDGTVTWSRPDWPVFIAIQKTSGTLALSKPTAVHQPKRSLQSMALVGGVLTRIISQDIRRGTMKDHAHLPQAMSGVMSSGVAKIAGHSMSAGRSGVTAAYIGDITEPIDTPKESLSYRHDFRLAVSGNPYPNVKRYLRAEEIEAYANEHKELDPLDKRDRETIGRRLLAQKQDEWFETEKNARKRPRKNDKMEEREIWQKFPRTHQLLSQISSFDQATFSRMSQNH